MTGPFVRMAAISVLAAGFQPAAHAQIISLYAKAVRVAATLKVTTVAEVAAAGPFYAGPASPRYVERPETKKFESFDAGNTAGLIVGAIGAGIADQRGFEYYRQSFFYGHQPYYGRPYYGVPSYYGGIYSPYYYKE